jgi:hypothetical protein
MMSLMHRPSLDIMSGAPANQVHVKPKGRLQSTLNTKLHQLDIPVAEKLVLNVNFNLGPRPLSMSRIPVNLQLEGKTLASQDVNVMLRALKNW